MHYRLDAALDDATGVVSGTAEIRYRHMGPDTLRSLTLSLGFAAFHPGARAWPARARAAPDATGFERILDIRARGAPAALAWPDAPDSSVARLPLPEGLAPGDSVVVTLRWEARPPALPWRSDRRGRRLQLVGWYPQVLNETSGTTVTTPALATLLIALDVSADQVIGGTGVPLCGDPGWRDAAAASPAPVTLQRDWYRAPRDPRAASARCEGAVPGRKRVTWYAEAVPEAAFALSPTFRYEEGDFLERPVHTLYERGEERVWGAGLATRRTEAALAWTLDLAGRYPWPQITVVQGLDRTGSALPMVLLADASGQATILDLLGLMITEQILPGGARVFTVGTAAFQAAWFFEALGRRGAYARLEREILDWDLDGLATDDEPLGSPSSTSPCASTYCRRTEFMSYQLRTWAGGNEAMQQLYHALYARFLLRPTVPGAFQQIAGELIRPKPDPLYRQLPRGGTLYDDAVAGARREPTGDGRWRTTVIVERRAAGLFPQTVWVVADGDTGVARAAALTPRETLTVVTRTRPKRVLLDPLAQSHDWNMLNNQRVLGFSSGWLVLAPERSADGYLDTYFSRKVARDRLTLGWAPTAWYNDAGGWTFGARLREDYLGRFELNEAWLSLGTGASADDAHKDLNARLRLRNPVWLRATGWSEELTLAWEEGRAAAGLGVTRSFRTRLADSTLRSLGIGLQWLSVTDTAYLDRRFYDDAGTAEVALTGRLATHGRWPLGLEATLGAGYAYPGGGAAIAGGAYGRFTAAATVRRRLGKALALGARVFAGAAVSGDSVPRQRRIYLSGADPYQRFDSPFLRSRGSLLARPGWFYQDPGGAGVRGLDPRVSGNQAVGGTLELECVVRQRPRPGLLSRIAVAAFADGALGNGDLDPARDRLQAVGDAGVGIRVDHRIGRTPFQTRFDFPLWVSRPAFAQDDKPAGAFGFRWGFSFAPSF